MEDIDIALVVVDVATRAMDTEPLKEQKAGAVLEAFKKIYVRKYLKWPTKFLQVDSGSTLGNPRESSPAVGCDLGLPATSLSHQSGEELAFLFQGLRALSTAPSVAPWAASPTSPPWPPLDSCDKQGPG